MKFKGTILCILLPVLLCVISISHGTEDYSGMTKSETSADNTLYVRGLISSIYTDRMQIAVRPPKSKRIIITIEPATVFEGFQQLGELEKKQQVKVWYFIDDSGNRAVKIKKMLELGC